MISLECIAVCYLNVNVCVLLFADLLSLELSSKDDKMSLMDIAGYSGLSESRVHLYHLCLF